MSRKPFLLLGAALTLPLAACSTLTSEPTTKGALDSFRALSMSKKDTCGTQREIAEHNSRFDTLKTGRDAVYKAPCELDRKQVASAAK